MVAKIAGENVAKSIQLGMEYAPQPPFNTGTPAEAGPELVEVVRAGFAGASS
jgi:cyclohexyl-isocyanide hydratase